MEEKKIMEDVSKILTVIGIKKVESKKNPGTFGWNMSFTHPYSDYETKNCDCLGLACKEIYTNRVDFSGIKLGDKLKLFFEEGFGGALIVTDFKLIK